MTVLGEFFFSLFIHTLSLFTFCMSDEGGLLMNTINPIAFFFFFFLFDTFCLFVNGWVGIHYWL